MAVFSQIAPGQQIPRVLPGIVDDYGPATPSADHEQMQPYWTTARDLLLGLEALKSAREKYLPKHPQEEADDYKYRLDNAVLTNIFADIIETLSSKPFDDELQIIDGSASETFIGKPIMVADKKNPGKLKDSGNRAGGLIEDIDGKGNHLHVFAHDVFYNGIASALDWIFVDYPNVPTNMNAAQQRAKNIRPYWYRIPALNMLEVQSAMVGGKEQIIYCRILICKVERDPKTYKNVERYQVREITRPKLEDADGIVSYGMPEWILWQLKEDAAAQQNKAVPEWEQIGNGVYSIGVIPVVPFLCGRREGSSWVIQPPMKSAASLQVELYQQETGLKNVKVLTCYPMLAANGVNLNDDKGNKRKVTIGPHTILNAPAPQEGGNPGNWEFVEPSAESCRFVADGIKTLKDELRELGRQPLTAQTAGITVISAAFASQKANSAIQAWAIMLKDALENALLLTAQWMSLPDEPEVKIKLDFELDLDDQGATVLQSMRQSGDLSRGTYWSEMKRKGVLSPEFDADAEEAALAEEGPSEEELLAAAGGGGNNPNDQPQGA